jgi:hypothetical protein
MLEPVAHPSRAVVRLAHLLGAVGLLFGASLSGSARAGSSAEWLSSTDGPSPTVTSKSGVGTAQATATAKVTSESIRTFCADQGGQGSSAQARAGVDACVNQQKPELGKTYTVQADCTSGRLQPLDGKTYVLDGLWDNSDVGGGRTRWKGPDGVVGRDSASGGLALSQQWEMLCPGRVSASVISKARSLSPSSGSAGAAASAAPASVCGGDPNCTEVNAFATSVVEFRASLQGNYKTLTTTLRFQNKLTRPLVLGYVLGSGGATDDRGNRYVVRDDATRGIGAIAHRNSVDDKFALAPGQTGDARFTLMWGGQQIFGNTFDLDLTVREIIPAGNGQSTLGPEYPLQIVGLVDGARAGGAAVAQTSGSAPASPAQQPAPAQNTQPMAGGTTQPSTGTPAPASPSLPSPFGTPATAGAGAHCAPGTSCYDAGAFSVTVNQSAAAVSGKNQLARFSVRVKNHTSQPLALAYKAGTNNAVDEQGNTFSWGRPGTRDGSVQGIGMIEGARIDPQFQLAPGGTRDAQISVTRFDAGPKPPGRSFTLDTVLVELRGSGQQWQKVREYAVHLAAPGSGVVPAVGQTPAANDGVQKASDLLKGLLGGK